MRIVVVEATIFGSDPQAVVVIADQCQDSIAAEPVAGPWLIAPAGDLAGGRIDAVQALPVGTHPQVARIPVQHGNVVAGQTARVSGNVDDTLETRRARCQAVEAATAGADPQRAIRIHQQRHDARIGQAARIRRIMRQSPNHPTAPIQKIEPAAVGADPQ